LKRKLSSERKYCWPRRGGRVNSEWTKWSSGCCYLCQPLQLCSITAVLLVSSCTALWLGHVWTTCPVSVPDSEMTSWLYALM